MRVAANVDPFAGSLLRARSGLQPEDVILRFGLHWGANLYVGQIATSGRTEVTALGDQVNEAARIEACATGGRALASKDLIERLDANDAATLGTTSTGLPTPHSQTCRPPPRRPAATHRRSPSATCRPGRQVASRERCRCPTQSLNERCRRSP